MKSLDNWSSKGWRFNVSTREPLLLARLPSLAPDRPAVFPAPNNSS
jgi:hypothetical protein